MSFLIGAVIVLAIIWFMIVSPGFRVVVISILILGGLAVWAIISNIDKQGEVRQQQEAKRREAHEQQEAKRLHLAATAIRAEDLELSNMTLTRTGTLEYWALKGIVANNSKYDLQALDFKISIQDCPRECRVIGQETASVRGGDGYSYERKPLVPAGQTRSFQYTSIEFKNLPPAKAMRWQYQIMGIRAVTLD